MTKSARPRRRPSAVFAKLILALAALLGGCTTGPGPGLNEHSRVVIGHGLDGDRTLLLQPVSGRLSSSFGPRGDPFTGESRLHKGLDFAAPRGTPVRAAGDGVVVNVGPRGGYGHYVRIRHDDRFETAYAHLDGYADALERGRRVRQGEPIGYVGSSGRSTGAHLHYEVLVDGSQVDPTAVGPSMVQTVKGSAIGALHAAKSGFDSLRDSVAETGADLLGLVGVPVTGVGGAD